MASRRRRKRASDRERRAADVPRCLDCGAAVEQRFCPSCGQKAGPARRSLFALLAEFWAESFALDGRLPRSLVPLVTKPGTLTREYNAGRRTRYVSPIKLYLMTCFALFTAYSVASWIDAIRVVPVAGVVPVGAPAAGDASEDEDDGPDLRISGIEDIPRDRPILRRLAERFERINRGDETWTELGSALLGYLPATLFLLLPLFALLLSIALVGAGTFYVEAFVFSLHAYSFTYLVLLVLAALPDGWPRWGLLLVPIYFVVALARAFDLAWYSAIVRSLLLGVVFVPILMAALAAAAFVAASA
jgi:hypothetical protein